MNTVHVYDMYLGLFELHLYRTLSQSLLAVCLYVFRQSFSVFDVEDSQLRRCEYYHFSFQCFRSRLPPRFRQHRALCRPSLLNLNENVGRNGIQVAHFRLRRQPIINGRSQVSSFSLVVFTPLSLISAFLHDLIPLSSTVPV